MEGVVAGSGPRDYWQWGMIRAIACWKTLQVRSFDSLLSLRVGQAWMLIMLPIGSKFNARRLGKAGRGIGHSGGDRQAEGTTTSLGNRSVMRKQKGGVNRPHPARGTLHLLGGDDKVRPRLRRGIHSFRQFQQILGVIHPVLPPAIHQFPQRITHHAFVNQTINNLDLHIQPSLS